MPDLAKVPHWRDMDQGMFLAHWVKRHSYPGYFDKLHEKYPDDDANIWWAIKGHHDKIHAGTFKGFEIPADHVHLLSVSQLLEELL